MDFMMYQNKMSLCIYLLMGRGLVIEMSRVLIPLPANQERRISCEKEVTY